MATDNDSKETKVSEQPIPQASTGAQPRILWDSSNMRSAYANVFNVAGTREEFVFLFGMNQAWDTGQRGLKVQLTDRIIMSPFAAKRFSILFNNVIKDYEKRYGTLDIEDIQPDTSTVH